MKNNHNGDFIHIDVATDRPTVRSSEHAAPFFYPQTTATQLVFRVFNVSSLLVFFGFFESVLKFE